MCLVGGISGDHKPYTKLSYSRVGYIGTLGTLHTCTLLHLDDYLGFDCGDVILIFINRMFCFLPVALASVWCLPFLDSVIDALLSAHTI
jgi:hypothetical protein